MTDLNDHRVDAIQKNADWLQEHGDEADSMEVAKRLGLIQGDINALLRELGE